MKTLNFNEAYCQRTKKMAIAIIKWYKNTKRKGDTARILGKQLIRSASSVAANFRAACRARSPAEYHAKMCIVVEECDEALFWMECFEELEWIDSSALIPLREECLIILKVMAKTKHNAKIRKTTQNP